MANQLNPAQQQAIDHCGGHVLIVGGPGTGKTYILAHRIARFVTYLKADKQVLAITFTNKAAAQLEYQLMALDVAKRHVFAGTFHAFCLELLRTHLDKTALPKDFKVASDDDLKNFDKSMRERISLIKSTQLVINPDEEFKMYTRALRQAGLIDADDILREALELLEDESICNTLQQQYPYIFIDAYEDINVVQHALLKRLAGNTGIVTAFGDPDQSIDRCHAAKVSLIHRFEQDFDGATVLKLNENLRYFRNRKIITHASMSDRAEADYVASQIEKMMGTHRILADIAILYRLDALRHVMTQALDHLGIPHQDENTLEYASAKVVLLSIHAAKGLEFSVVFIIGCEDKLLPLDVEHMKADIEAERRLFFVGMSRAKECLYLTYAHRRQLFGKPVQLSPSPFLPDIHESPKKFKKQAQADHGQMQLF